MSDFFPYLPDQANLAYWCSRSRKIDASQNWFEMLTRLASSVGISATGKDSVSLECDTYKAYLTAWGKTVPYNISIYDLRNIFFKEFAALFGVTDRGNAGDNINAALGVSKFAPVYYSGSNRLFHCGFNLHSFDEQSKTYADIGAALAPAIGSKYSKSLLGLVCSASILTWTVTLPTLANFGALTVAVIVKYSAGTARVLLTNFASGSLNGSFKLGNTAANRVYMTVYAGGGPMTVYSDLATPLVNGNTYDIRAIIDGSNSRIYIDGVAQAEIKALGATPAFLNTGKMYVGLTGSEFTGSIFEAAVYGDITI